MSLDRCLSKLTQLVSLPYSQERSTHFPDRLHDISVTIPKCYLDVPVSSLFLHTARLWILCLLNAFLWLMIYAVKNPSPFIKGGWGLVRFSKNGYNGGSEIVARNGGGGKIKESMGSCSIEKYFLCSGFEISCKEFLWM